MAGMPGGPRFRRWRVAGALLATLAVVLLLGEAYFRLSTPAIYSAGANAIWLRHAWVGEAKGPQDYAALVDKLRTMKITHAYFHAGPFTGEGTVRPDRVAAAAGLVAAMGQGCPEVKVIAWLGQIEARAGGILDITAADNRARMVETARWFLDLGYDGVHYDIEPIYSGDQDFLDLLTTTRLHTSAAGAELSVAASMPEWLPGLERFLRRFVKHPGCWTERYFLAVAACVDQVAVMTYDTAIPVPFIYGRLVARTVRWCAAAGVPDVLIGIPTYGGFTGGHWPWAENVTTALRGLKHGLAALEPALRPGFGAAVFAEWTTSEEEISSYVKLWVGPMGDR